MKQPPLEKPEIWWKAETGLEPETVWVIRHTTSSVWLKNEPYERRPRRTQEMLFARTRLECLTFLMRATEEYTAEQREQAEYHSKNAAVGDSLVAKYKDRIALEEQHPTVPPEPKSLPKDVEV